MSDNDKVVEFKSRRPLASVQQEKAEKEAVSKKAQDEMAIEELEMLLERAKAGTLTDMIVVARNPESGFFYTNVLFDRQVDMHKGFAMAGVLETLKLEMIDMAALAPAYMADGTVFDPMQEPEEIFEE